MATRYLAVVSTSIAIFALLHSYCNQVWGLSLGLSSFFEKPLHILSPSASDYQEPLGSIGVAKSTKLAHNSPNHSWDLFSHLGGNGPWIPKRTGVANISIDVPSICRVSQVHMNWTFFAEDPEESFESLVATGPFAGTLEAFQTGVKLRSRYPHLLTEALNHKATAFWASDSRRVIDTARYFGAGFFGIDWERISNLVVISEDVQRGADTLTPGKTCPKYRDADDEAGREKGYRMRDQWRKVYEPGIIKRLAVENPDFTFTEDEIFTMQTMCGFETIVRGESPWCKVFTHEEWESFAYARDVLHYYRAGPGNPYSASMGWLWLNATANLLRFGPMAGPLFFSFVHDGDVVPLLHALDLFPQHPELPTTHIPQNRTWKTSDIVPMGGRVLIELLECQFPPNCYSNAPLYPNHIYCEPQPQSLDPFVRINVNDGIVAIPGCDSGPGYSCPFNDFLNLVSERGKQAGDFREVCGLNGTNTGDQITFLHQWDMRGW